MKSMIYSNYLAFHHWIAGIQIKTEVFNMRLCYKGKKNWIIVKTCVVVLGLEAKINRNVYGR